VDTQDIVFQAFSVLAYLLDHGISHECDTIGLHSLQININCT